MPKPQNAYLARRARIRAIEADAWEETTRQLMLDTLQITLHRELGFGFDRVLKITLAWAETYNHYYGVFDPRLPECDVLRHHLDAELMDILKDKHPHAPFDERYRFIRDVPLDSKRR